MKQEYKSHYAKSLEGWAQIAWSEMQKVAKQREYTSTHRHEKLKGFAALGKVDVQREFESYQESIAKVRESLEQRAYVPRIPEDVDMARVLYLKDAIQAGWSRIDTPAMRKEYADAIQKGDKETALIYRDFADHWLSQNRRQTSTITGRPVDATNSVSTFKTLHEQAQAELFTPEEAQKAIADLQTLEVDARELVQAKNHWMASFDKFKIDDKSGELMDAYDVNYESTIKEMIRF